jgi:hypothetical protein
MSGKKQVIGLLLTILALQLSMVNAGLSANVPTNNYYLIQNKESGNCISMKFSKNPLIYAACTATTADTKFQFKLNPTGTDYTISLRNAANGFDVATGSVNVFNWPSDTPTSTNSQKWTATLAKTDAGIEWYIFKNLAKTECLAYDATNKDPNDNAVIFPSTTTCPTDPATAADKFLFKLFRIKVTVSGVIKYSTTDANVPATIMAKDVPKITFNKPDGSKYADATVDANAATYTIDVDTDTTYTVVPAIYDAFSTTANFSIKVEGSSLNAANNSAITTVKVSPYQYTWKLKVTWTGPITDLDIYIKSSQSCFYWNKLGSTINFNKSWETSGADEIDLLPTYTDDYVVYVKNYSREGLLKDSTAKLTIERRRADNTLFPATSDSVTIKTDTHLASERQWKVLTISAPTQTYTVTNKVCLDALNNCNA